MHSTMFSVTAMLAFTFAVHDAAAQATSCPPAVYFGFHQERVGAVLVSEGSEALFGHGNGWNCGFFARHRDDYWRRTTLMGGVGPNYGTAGASAAFENGVVLLGDPQEYSMPGFWQQSPNGSAIIYERVNGTWTRTAQFYPQNPVPGASGYAYYVALEDDGTRAVVAASRTNAGGTIYVYHKQPSGWALEQTIDGNSLTPPAVLDGPVALTQGHLFLASRTSYFPAPGPGEVRVLTRQSGTWTEVATLAPPQLSPTARFGVSMATDSGHAVIASVVQPYPNSTAQGIVFEYDTSLPNWTTQPTVISLPTSSTTTLFGRSLDLDGDRLAIGARDEAFVYERGPTSWQRTVRVVPPPTGFSSQFGQAVALFPDGLLVGDPTHDDDPWQYPDNPGGVHAFDLTDYGREFQGCGRGVAIEWGGTLTMRVRWPQQANNSYQVFGSFTGFGPTVVHGVPIPLTQDLYTSVLIANPSFITGGTGMLNQWGAANLTWNVPQGLPASLDGAQFHHAIVAWDSNGTLAASNAITSELVKIY